MEESRLKQQVKWAARGDEQAAVELFDHYYPRVYRYALSKLGSDHDAQDVASEAFAKVLRDLDRFRWKGAGFEAWLFRIASNLIIDHFRKNGREELRDTTTDSGATSSEESPETILLDMEMRDELGGMLARLSEDQREVLLLRFAGGLDTNEVAKVMGRKANAVRQLQFRALDTLRARMSDVGSL